MKSNEKIKTPKKKKVGIYRVAMIGIIVALLVLAFLFMQNRDYLSAYMQYRKYEKVPQTLEEAIQNTPLTEKDFLKASGTEIMNRDGEEIVLTGVNLGGWLVHEYWMCPVYGDPEAGQFWAQMDTLQALSERFGEKSARRLLEQYADNWITEWDIRNIAALGCNVIRVPFGYWSFMSDDTGTWLTEDAEENPGFQRFDWLLETAEKYGIYVILDMHGCPGGQSYDSCDGTSGDYLLFQNSECQDVMEKLWVAIAERYKEEPALAGYDIMNEGEYYSGDVENDPRNMIYDRMYRAIRQVDPEHIIFMEAIWELSCLPVPVQAGWENVVYETHPYDKNDAETYCNGLLEYAQNNQVPVYVGECMSMKMLDTCRKYGISCTPWTYKGTSYAEGTWYMYYTDQLAMADVLNDPEWLIEMKWGKCIRTQFYEPMEEVLSHYR